MLGGVCSGISAYFGWDPIWLRIGFLISFFTVGFGFIPYIILWIAMPPARTPIEKLQMRGEDVTLKNLEESIKKEAHAVSDSLKRTANELRTHQLGNTFSNFVTEVFKVIGQIFKGVLLAILIMTSFLFFVVTVSVLFGNFHIGNHHSAMIQNIYSVLPAGNIWLIKVGAALAGFAPAVVILLWALKSIFKWQLNTGYVILTGLVLFGAGVITLVSVGKSVSENFENTATVRHSQENYLPNKQLVVKMNGTSEELDYDINNFSFFGTDFHTRTINNDDTIVLNNVEFTIERSDNDSMQIITSAYSSGSSYSEARNLASNIQYTYSLDDSILTLPRNINIDKHTPWRNQHVRVIIRVPLNTKVTLHKNIRSYIDDNTHFAEDDYNTEKLGGHRFIMVSDGLQCINCSDSDKLKHDEDDDDDDEPKKMHHKEHDINGKLKKIKLDNHGVEVTVDDKGTRHKIKVDGDSVSVK